MSSAAVDKQALYGNFQKSADWKDNLSKSAAYKALDIAEDDTNITSTVTHNHAAPAPAKASRLQTAILALVAVSAGASGMFWLNMMEGQKPPAPAVAPAATAPAPASAWDAIYEQQMPDGSWKQLKREHLKPGG